MPRTIMYVHVNITVYANVRRTLGRPMKNSSEEYYKHSITSPQNTLLKSPNYPGERCPKSGTNVFPNFLNLYQQTNFPP